ncbi:MAG: ATP-dependent helicase [Desulfamplus sp.]|nr:ATP-dependent helicase [Desulfamplus sp.]
MINLNHRQKESASFLYGTACVISTPGSGKTTTMTHRIKELVEKHGVPPESILGLTFTKNAAQSMRDKLSPLLNSKASRVVLATIHSFCYSLLKQEGKVFELLQGNDQLKFIKQVMKKKKIKNIPVGLIIREINLAKNNLVTADDFKEIYSEDKTMMAIGELYSAYEDEKRKKLMLDFNDLLFETYNLLSQNKEIREKYQDIYRNILVDEYQDTTPLQVEILKLLITNDKTSSFWVCADDWQSIYSFTGASVGNILNFNKVFPRSKQFILDINYRSTPEILGLCQNLINHNTRKIDKILKTDNLSGADAVIISAANEDDEAVQIVNEIIGLIEVNGYSFKDIAVLYRSNNLSRPIEDCLKQNEIPYHIENGSSFYQRREVKLLLDYLRVINNPDSDEADEALRNIINVPNRYIGKTFMVGLEEFATERNEHLYIALKHMPVEIPYLRKHIREFLELMNPLTRDANLLEPSDIIHILRDGLDYDRYISDDDVPTPDDSKIENINQLQLVAAKYQRIGDLLNFTESFKEENTCNKNGVALMTVHKSKGLEFKVVFLIGLADGVMPNKNGDIEEERRIVFVALSRAMELLYLTYPQTYSGRSIKKSRFLTEIFES